MSIQRTANTPRTAVEGMNIHHHCYDVTAASREILPYISLWWVTKAALYCAHRTICTIPPSLLVFPLLEGHPCWSMCGRRTRPFSGRAFREHRTNVGVLPLFHRAG